MDNNCEFEVLLITQVKEENAIETIREFLEDRGDMDDIMQIQLEEVVLSLKK